MKIGIIILSRYSSSRLPGKALMKINGKEILNYIVERLLKVVSRNNIVIATSFDQSDDKIAEFALRNNVNCFRGSLENVSLRFCQAAEYYNFDYAIRINGDNIFLDIELLRSMITLTKNKDFDFISNVKGRTFPKGMSIEIVKTEYYKAQLKKINLSPELFEHVTLFLYSLDGNFHFIYNHKLPEAAGLQFALDTIEDFDRTEKIINEMEKNHTEYNLEEIYQIFKKLNI